YQKWASELSQRAEHVLDDYGYWLGLTQMQPPDCLMPDGKQQNTVGNSRLHTAQLSVNATRALLTQVSAVYNTQITETLLVALSQTLTDWLQTQTVIVALESYGRLSEKLDISRTVGWFTALYPAQLTFDNALSLGENIQAIKAQLREIPSQGLSYGLLRYLGQRSELELNLPISFNYLGQLDGTEEDVFRRVPGPRLNQANELNQADENVRSHLIDLNCWIEDSQLQLHWTYSPHHHSSEQIAIVAQQFINNLEALIQHCCEHEASYASTDFDLVQLNQSALESVLAQVSFDSDLAEQNAAQEVSP
ncbi:MAG: condensation domain-containing protein, partial [Cyanobacteria bacterium J06631_9]